MSEECLFLGLTAKGDVTCVVCKYVVPCALFDEKISTYIVHFNSQENTKVRRKKKGDDQVWVIYWAVEKIIIFWVGPSLFDIL